MLNTVLDSHKFRISVKAGKFYYQQKSKIFINHCQKFANQFRYDKNYKIIQNDFRTCPEPLLPAMSKPD
jgi:hypothetical protein